MKFFCGDGLAMQFEAVNQTGGRYFFLNCGISYIQTDNISHCYQLSLAILSCKQKKSYRWEIWERKLNPGQSKTFHSLKKERIDARTVFLIH